MINIDSIFRSVSGDVEDGLGDDGCELTNSGLLELITRLREAEKDAARYRWLANQSKQWVPGTHGVILVTVNDNYERPSYATIREVDSFIDEAMQCK